MTILQGEPLSRHTTFKIGGPADFYARPEGDKFPEEAAALLRSARADGKRVFILGAGSNIVASDDGFRGLVLDTGGWAGCALNEETLVVRSGTPCDDAANFAKDHALTGLEFLAGLPGSVGGALWMNARCYEKSVADILIDTEILNESLRRETVPFRPQDWGYKKSPFQQRNELILSARFRVEKGSITSIEQEMAAHRKDREAKGHFSYPSAGSVFKNNHKFGKPTGKIVDELGLRGTQIGGARLADWHGNFIINTGSATAKDVAALVAHIQAKARATLGIELEPEILFL